MTACSVNNNSFSVDYFQAVPSDIKNEIFSSFDGKSLNSCRFVCKKWNQLVSIEFKKRINNILKQGFGKDKWEKYYGTVGKEPRLPGNIIEILESPNPYNPKRSIAQDFSLVLIPQTLNGKRIDDFINAIEAPKEGHSAEIGHNLPEHFDLFPHSYWALVSNDIVEGSMGISFKHQVELITQKPNFKIPALMEMIIAIFTYHVESGLPFYPCGSYTHCSESTLVFGEAVHYRAGGYYSWEIPVLPNHPWQIAQSPLGMGAVMRLPVPPEASKKRKQDDESVTSPFNNKKLMSESHDSISSK